MKSPIIVWFRSDLRLQDNLALMEAIGDNSTIIPLFILENTENWPLGGASQWWLHHSLTALDLSLKERGSSLCLKRGNPLEILKEIISETGARHVYWNRRYEPHTIPLDSAIKKELSDLGILVKTFNSHLLFEPWTIQTKQGTPFRVFTKFWNSCLDQANIPKPIPAPSTIPSHPHPGDDIASLGLLPTKPDWSGGLRDEWHPGEKGAHQRFDDFMDALPPYKEDRNRPDRAATSKLSPHLKWGEISVREIWHRIHAHMAHYPASETGAHCFLSEIGWREFSYHLLYHVPTLPSEPIQQKFKEFPWQEGGDDLTSWQRGMTGYPIVDAGMRQLWQTGWMHNRVRMIVASFLVKDLLLPWQAGASWFWDTLVDADLANNSASWQWVAGCGADAAPYFRVFNPVLQGEKFDPDGTYVRQWVPELARLPNTLIHKPWTSTRDHLMKADVILGKTYPEPLVDHAKARLRTLKIFNELKRKIAQPD